MLQGRLTGRGGGRTRTCPHCKATILESAAVCPQCKHHLRFGVDAVPVPQRESVSALRVEGSLRQPPGAAESEYSVLLTIRNERGEEVSRQLVGVGALRPSETRTFTLSVEVHNPGSGGSK